MGNTISRLTKLGLIFLLAGGMTLGYQGIATFMGTDRAAGDLGWKNLNLANMFIGCDILGPPFSADCDIIIRKRYDECVRKPCQNPDFGMSRITILKRRTDRMAEKENLLYDDAIAELETFGITGAQIYLIDLIPLIEMIWADGKAQDAEVSILADYLKTHVKHINELAGYEALSLAAAKKFVKRFLASRPDPQLLASLRSLIAPVRLAGSNTEVRKELKASMLAACLDIAASSVKEYPFGLNERFNKEEKRCFFEILESLS
jgi:hypothetical protein